MMVTDKCIMDEGTANGYIIVMDMSGVVFGHLAKLGILTMKKFLIFLQVSRTSNYKSQRSYIRNVAKLYKVNIKFGSKFDDSAIDQRWLCCHLSCRFSPTQYHYASI